MGRLPSGAGGDPAVRGRRILSAAQSSLGRRRSGRRGGSRLGRIVTAGFRRRPRTVDLLRRTDPCSRTARTRRVGPPRRPPGGRCWRARRAGSRGRRLRSAGGARQGGCAGGGGRRGAGVRPAPRRLRAGVGPAVGGSGGGCGPLSIFSVFGPWIGEDEDEHDREADRDLLLLRLLGLEGVDALCHQRWLLRSGRLAVRAAARARPARRAAAAGAGSECAGESVP